MSAPDFAAKLELLSDGEGCNFGDDVIASILDLRVPEACHPCGGAGVKVESDGDYEGAGYHEVECDCPTVADLLRWGFNVATAKQCDRIYGSFELGSNDRLCALRTPREAQ